MSRSKGGSYWWYVLTWSVRTTIVDMVMENVREVKSIILKNCNTNTTNSTPA